MRSVLNTCSTNNSNYDNDDDGNGKYSLVCGFILDTFNRIASIIEKFRYFWPSVCKNATSVKQNRRRYSCVY